MGSQPNISKLESLSQDLELQREHEVLTPPYTLLQQVLDAGWNKNIQDQFPPFSTSWHRLPSSSGWAPPRRTGTTMTSSSWRRSRTRSRPPPPAHPPPRPPPTLTRPWLRSTWG